MPNWTENTIRINKDVIKKYLDEDGNFDFNKLIEMPKELDITSGSPTSYGIIYYAQLHPEELEICNKAYSVLNLFNGHIEDEEMYKEDNTNNDNYEKDLAEGTQGIENYKKYGFVTWYEWSVANWGTKWNASDTYIEDVDDKMCDVHFSTAWNVPIKIILKLCELNPEEDIKFTWVDEDYTGTYHAHNENGVLVEDDVDYDESYYENFECDDEA